MTNEELKGKVAALLEEKRGYEMYGKTDRVAEVDAELKRLGAGGRAPAKRAEKRKSTAKAKKK